MFHPKVIFVDGPTAVGKGTFIKSLVDGFLKLFPGKTILTLVATDFVLKDTAKTELRKYTTYDTEKNKVRGVFRGHLDLIDFIKDNLTSNRAGRPDIVIVDRSFLTFLCYNVWKDEDEDKRELYVDQYRIYISVCLSGIKTLHVQLNCGVEDKRRIVNILLSRIAERNDNKQVDIGWVYQMLDNYEAYGKLVEKVFTHYENITSNDHNLIFDRYYKSLYLGEWL